MGIVRNDITFTEVFRAHKNMTKQYIIAQLDAASKQPLDSHRNILWQRIKTCSWYELTVRCFARAIVATISPTSGHFHHHSAESSRNWAFHVVWLKMATKPDLIWRRFAGKSKIRSLANIYNGYWPELLTRISASAQNNDLVQYLLTLAHKGQSDMFVTVNSMHQNKCHWVWYTRDTLNDIW